MAIVPQLIVLQRYREVENLTGELCVYLSKGARSSDKYDGTYPLETLTLGVTFAWQSSLQRKLLDFESWRFVVPGPLKRVCTLLIDALVFEQVDAFCLTSVLVGKQLLSIVGSQRR